MIATVILLSQIFIFVWYNSLDNNDKNETKIERLAIAANQSERALETFSAAAHWVFSVEYLKTALLFPIIMDLEQEGAAEKVRKVYRQIKIVNVVFYFFLFMQ